MSQKERTIGYVFASGEGTVGRQSIHLLRSIRRFHGDVPVYVFVPEDERDRMDASVLEALESDAELLTGSIPIPDYPISTKIKALAEAEQISNTDYLLMLDTDTLVLDEINLHRESPADLYLKPVDVGRQFWGRERSHEWWVQLYEKSGYEYPSMRVYSTFDHRKILPYWNAGFVLVRTGDFGREWLTTTRELYGQIPYDRHADQVALGLLSTQYRTETIEKEYNYPLHLRMMCPSDVKILHYHEEVHLSKYLSSSVRERIHEVGLQHELPKWSPTYLVFMLSCISMYVRRRTLPIDETHTLERLYLKVRSVVR